jgi:uncharacterized membrane-anchored protein
MSQTETFAAAPTAAPSTKWWARQMLNKVPEVTLYFWVIKVLCTTVGETAADTLNEKVGLGLTNTTYIMGAFLIATLVAQFRARKYMPGIYWLAVVLLSIVGTLITDNMAEHGVALMTTNIAFGAALLATFAIWYGFERTLSVHTIYTTRREAFYWLVILFTFALGTSTGDYLSEKLELGYLTAVAIFAAAIAVVAILHFGLRLNAILSFWLAYILTRPLGASIGDYLASPIEEGGLGLGVYVTSAIFLVAILALVVFLIRSKRDVIRSGPIRAAAADGTPTVLVVLNKVEASPQLLAAVAARAAHGAARFFVLVPNPGHLAFDRVEPDTGAGAVLLAQALPRLQGSAEGEIEGRVADSPNAYDDITAELGAGSYDEIILETPPSHLSHWLHVDLPHRIAELGYPLTTVAAGAA